MITINEIGDAVGRRFLFDGDEITLVAVREWAGVVEYSDESGIIFTEKTGDFLDLLEWVEEEEKTGFALE